MATDDFRVPYSKLIKAIWNDPAVEGQVSKDPSLLVKQYGFPIPKDAVKFAPTNGPDTTAGYNKLKAEYDDPHHTSITFYIPPKPSIYEHPINPADSCCCCCSCPCCSCT